MKDNTIVGYYNGKAIAIEENNHIVYFEMPKENVSIGEVLDGKPIETLTSDEQDEIRFYVAENGLKYESDGD